MKTKRLLACYLALMAALIAYGLIAPESLLTLVRRPSLYPHAKFVHILAVTLFFANAVIGTLWETRSLLSGRADLVRFTYQTVVWLDAVLTAPLILISVLSGLLLGTVLGGVWTIGWLSIAFALFLFSGGVWVLADIPTQYRIKREFERLDETERALPPRLRRLLWRRAGISALGTLPLLVIFYLMVHKPDLPPLGRWLTGTR